MSHKDRGKLSFYRDFFLRKALHFSQKLRGSWTKMLGCSVGKKAHFGETPLFRVTDDMMHSNSVKFHLLANKVQQKLNMFMGSKGNL